jgi:solute carrier family 32 (vesicular inhibitory amino acid transporter)
MATEISGRSVPSSEDSPLLPVAESGEGSSPASADSRQSQLLWQELEHPWPATFERAIGLLASPMIKAQDVDIYIKSPKPGSTPLALARRTNLDRGFYTPDSHGLLFGPRQSGSERDGDFRKSLSTMKSLDFGVQVPDPKKVLKDQQQKANKAKEYRANILKKTSQEDDGLLSPGFGREMQSMRISKKKTVDAHKPPGMDAKATFSQCAFNLSNILMGVGLLGLPYVFKSAGWYGGSFCLGVFGLITWRTSILIGRELNGDPRPSHYFDDSPFKSPLQPGSVADARMLPPISSFPDIARVAFGSKACLVLSVILYFELFSCICIFFVSMGAHLHQLFPTISSAHHTLVVAAASIIPTILLRTPTLLSYLSMVGTIATVCVVLSVMAAALVEGDISERVAVEEEGIAEGPPYHTDWKTSGLTLAFGLVAYCFSGHAIVPAIYTSMQKPQDFEKMVTATFIVVTGCCLAVAVSGYYMFGSVVQDQVTLSLEQSSHAGGAMKALTWLMILTAFSKVTLTMFPLALGVEETIAPYLTSERMVDASASVIKLIFTALALVVSIYVPSFSFLCALVGMICTMSVSVIFPAAAHLQMFGPSLSPTEKILDWAFVILGFVMAIVGTLVTLQDM